jgi:hypothetical protein
MMQILFKPTITTTIMKINNLLGLLLIMLIPAIGIAQNNLHAIMTTWIITEQTDLSSGNTIQISIVLVSDSIIVCGPSVEDGFPMSFTNISGNWDASTNMDNVTYSLLFEDGTGTAALSGTGNYQFITLDLTFVNGSSRIKLKADSITYV